MLFRSPAPKYTLAGNVSKDIRDLTIDPDKYTPPDMIRPWVNEWPKDLKIDPAAMMGGRPPATK